MFDAFKKVFLPDGEALAHKVARSVSMVVNDDVRELLIQFGGLSFNHGIYRIISAIDVAHWNDLVLSAFPQFSGRITCFAIDWLGRVFALDSARLEEMRPGVVMFEPGTGKALQIPCNIKTFHESELIQYQEEALAESFYGKWLAHGGAEPNYKQCIGYKRHLFLGGSDTVDNLGVSDLDVYWTISAQLIQKVRGLAPGTAIGKVTIE